MQLKETPLRIVVLGGGFGGTYAIKELDRLRSTLKMDFEVILFDPRKYFVFTPLLHEVATAGLELEHVTIPFRHLFREKPWILHVKEKVTSINLDLKTLRAAAKEYRFDYLILATGSKTNYYGNLRIAHHSLTLKNEENAEHIRLALEQALLDAAKTKHSKRQEELLSVTVIGGGPTGVELSCEISQFLYHRLKKQYKRVPPEAISVHLLQGAPVLLPFASTRMQDAAAKGLRRRDVTLSTSAKVKSVTEKHVLYEKDGQEHKLESHLTIWVAGVTPNLLKGFEGYYFVKEDLSLVKHDTFFAIGDAAHYDPTCFLAPNPALGQVAVQEGIAAAQNLVRRINGRKTKPFIYKSKGFLVSLGQHYAAAEIQLPFGSIFFKGFFAWWLWRTIYMMKFLDARQRVKSVASWTGRLFTRRSLIKKK